MSTQPHSICRKLPPHQRHLSKRAPGLLWVLRETGPGHVLPDYSHKHRRHGVNVQVVTDPAGRLLWNSPALIGRAHDLTAARAHGTVFASAP